MIDSSTSSSEPDSEEEATIFSEVLASNTFPKKYKPPKFWNKEYLET